MEHSPEEAGNKLIALLQRQLTEVEDADAAIAVYKMANWIETRLDQLKTTALGLARQDIEDKGLDGIKTMAGSAGWTEPKTRQLDEQAWLQALYNDPELMKVQREYDLAEAALRLAQEPYTRLPESRFFIR